MNGFGAIKWLARGGFLVKGVLYMVIGALALQVAAKAGGRVTGTRGVLTTVLGQPFGRTLLLVVVVGLLGYHDRLVRHYAMWKTIVDDPSHPAQEKIRAVRDDPDVSSPEPVRRSGPKVGPNDPCPCGSGRKCKKCCRA
jgi:hypothetical protein